MEDKFKECKRCFDEYYKIQMEIEFNYCRECTGSSIDCKVVPDYIPDKQGIKWILQHINTKYKEK